MMTVYHVCQTEDANELHGHGNEQIDLSEGSKTSHTDLGLKDASQAQIRNLIYVI